MRLGLVAYGLAFAVAIALVESSLPASWRTLAFIPFHLGGIFVFQAAYGTCPMHAMRGQRETALGVERVANPTDRRLARRRALRVFSTATLSALVATSLLLLLP